VAPERLPYGGPGTPVRDRSDRRAGPTARTEIADPLAFLARPVTHIPNKHQVMRRYYGWYATRPRRAGRGGAGPNSCGASIRVDPLACPVGGDAMRILAFITDGAVIDRILAHLRRAREAARDPPPECRHAPLTAPAAAAVPGPAAPRRPSQHLEQATTTPGRG